MQWGRLYLHLERGVYQNAVSEQLFGVTKATYRTLGGWQDGEKLLYLVQTTLAKRCTLDSDLLHLLEFGLLLLLGPEDLSLELVVGVRIGNGLVLDGEALN